jgi:hypothetical protein
MSGGLFGFTSFYSETQDFNPQEALKEGAGYGLLRYETEPNYKQTKDINDKIGYLTQPTKTIELDPKLKPFTINDISRTMDGTYGLNASWYNGLRDKNPEFNYGTELYFPQAYPNHYYNTQKFAPIYNAINKPSYPI